MAKIVGLFATIAPSCQRFTSRESEGKKQYKDKEKDYSYKLNKNKSNEVKITTMTT